MHLDETIDIIKEAHRTRYAAMEQRKRILLSLGSFLRVYLGWSPDLPKAKASRIRAQAQALIKLGVADARALKKPNGTPFETDEPDYLKWRDYILASLGAREPFKTIEKVATQEMEARAITLPAWEWGEQIRGFGAVSLAVIVGEAGDLSGYPKKGHLWKRMGVAVMGDVRQGGLPKSAPAAAWIEHGYNRKRRSRMWNIGDALIKGNDDGEYRAVYLERKVYERERAEAAGLTVAPSADIPKGRASEFMSEGHIHRRAQRIMEKRLLRDLWQAWRRARLGVPELTMPALPVAAE